MLASPFFHCFANRWAFRSSRNTLTSGKLGAFFLGLLTGSTHECTFWNHTTQYLYGMIMLPPFFDEVECNVTYQAQNYKIDKYHKKSKSFEKSKFFFHSHNLLIDTFIAESII